MTIEDICIRGILGAALWAITYLTGALHACMQYDPVIYNNKTATLSLYLLVPATLIGTAAMAIFF